MNAHEETIKATANYKKAVEKIEKLQSTLLRHKKTLAKKEKILADSIANNCEKWYYKFDVEEAIDAIKATAERIKEAIEKAEKLRLKIDVAKAKDAEMEALPESVKRFAQFVEKKMNERLHILREIVRDFIKEEGWGEAHKRFGIVASDMYHADEEYINAKAKLQAKQLVRDFVIRVKKVAGEMVDFSRITFNGAELNGYVKGDKGCAEVFTIEAGGYNIQCLHYRVLVKPRKSI